jgi:small redox-active disulfide protein 2
MSDDVKLIWIGDSQLGLAGLDAILKEAQEKELAGDDLRQFLLEETKRRNYVPRFAEEQYGDALVREYRRFCGEEVGEEHPSMLEVKVLGVGCPECDRLEQDVKNVLSELGVVGQVEHVRDPLKIAEYGIFAGPALVINDKMMAAGRVPARSDLEKWLKDAEGK